MRSASEPSLCARAEDVDAIQLLPNIDQAARTALRQSQVRRRPAENQLIVLCPSLSIVLLGDLRTHEHLDTLTRWAILKRSLTARDHAKPRHCNEELFFFLLAIHIRNPVHFASDTAQWPNETLVVDPWRLSGNSSGAESISDRTDALSATAGGE